MFKKNVLERITLEMHKKNILDRITVKKEKKKVLEKISLEKHKKNVLDRITLKKEKITSSADHQQHQNLKKSRFLITVNVVGSTGPIRFVVNEDDVVAGVIDTALKSYAREGRLPILGSDVNHFLLRSCNAGSDSLSPWETIGSHGGRNFVLCKKQRPPQIANSTKSNMTPPIPKESSSSVSSWKPWLKKSIHFQHVISLRHLHACMGI